MRGKTIFGGIPFDDEHVRDCCQRTHFKFMRTASFSNEALFGHLDGDDNTPLRSRGIREKRLRIVGREWKMWIGLHELEKFMAHQTHNKSGNHGIITTASGAHCEYQVSRSIGSIAAAHLQTVAQHRITSSSHGPETFAEQTAVT